MKKNIQTIGISLLFLANSMFVNAQENFQLNATHIMHNKGQLTDKNGAARKDIDFVLQGNDMQVLIGAGKLEYCFIENGGYQSVKMQLLNTQAQPKCLAECKSNYSENYYLGNKKIEDVPASERICYKNIYKGIDWVLYLSKGKLEHEFVIRKGADARQIKWKYKGADEQSIDRKGNIVIKSGHCTLIEKAPQSFSQIGNGLISSYKKNNGQFAYYLPKRKPPYTIDPSLEWATYQRGNYDQTQSFSATKDNKGHIYITGRTTAIAGLASAGVHQSANAGVTDGFISKFDTFGHHIWTTYYGGADVDVFWDMQYQNGKLYLVGQTSSSTGIATASTQQPILSTYAGILPVNAMLVKMDTNGKRIWGTYCGDGSGGTYFAGLAIDSKENIYCVGNSIDSSLVASKGTFKDTFAHKKNNIYNESDAILIKYDSSGRRVWGTYIGDTAEDQAQTVVIYNDIVYIGGHTRSQRGIATAGTYKSSFTPSDASESDVFLMRFDTAGNRLWGTYYGGKGTESTPLMALSNNGYLYVYGHAVNGDTALASPGAYQTTAPGGIGDCFIAKFDTTSKRIWGSYISSTFFDETTILSGKITVEENADDGNVWITGQTRGTGKGIATADAYKDTLNASGKRDAFLACISPMGKPIYYTYYGGEADDWANCAFVYGQTAYLIGYTLSTTGIATPGSYKDTHTGLEPAAYIAKFAPSKPSAIRNIETLPIDLQLYPNPSSDFIYLSANTNISGHSEAIIELVNVVGKTVQTERTNTINGKLNYQLIFYQSIQPGLYQIVVTIGGHRTTKRFLKER